MPPGEGVILESVSLETSFSRVAPIEVEDDTPVPPRVRDLVPVLSSGVVTDGMGAEVVDSGRYFRFNALSGFFIMSGTPSSFAS